MVALDLVPQSPDHRICTEFYVLHGDSPQASSYACSPVHALSCARNTAWHGGFRQNQRSTSHLEHAFHLAAPSSSAFALQNELPQRHTFAVVLRFLLAAGCFSTAGAAAFAAAAAS